MKRIFRSFVKTSVKVIGLALLLLLLISMTGCSRRYVVVDGDKPANVTQGEVDKLYQDNELLLKALEGCRAEK